MMDKCNFCGYGSENVYEDFLVFGLADKKRVAIDIDNCQVKDILSEHYSVMERPRIGRVEPFKNTIDLSKDNCIDAGVMSQLHIEENPGLYFFMSINKDGHQEKATSIVLNVNFCPFCGRKLRKEVSSPYEDEKHRLLLAIQNFAEELKEVEE